jgi:hypothetical protein
MVKLVVAFPYRDGDGDGDGHGLHGPGTRAKT